MKYISISRSWAVVVLGSPGGAWKIGVIVYPSGESWVFMWAGKASGELFFMAWRWFQNLWRRSFFVMPTYCSEHVSQVTR